MKREAPVGVLISILALIVMVSVPFLAPRAGTGSAAMTGATTAATEARSVTEEDGVEVSEGDRAHDHDLPITAPHWYVTVHGEAGALAQVFAIDGSGKVLGPVLGPLPGGQPPLSELRGMMVVGNGDLAVVSAKSEATRVLLFGAADAKSGIRPYMRTWAARGEANPAMVHAYQIAIGPDGALYAANQDTNTVTRYAGLGAQEPGRPLPVAAGLAQFGTMFPGTVVPNDQQSPEGVGLVRGFTFGADGLLYVCDRGHMRVAAYDPATGRWVRDVMTAADGLEHPIQAIFTPDGRELLVTDNKIDCVWKRDMETGRISQLVSPKEGGLSAASSIVMRGKVLYVGSRLSKQILKYDAKHGKFLGVFAELPSNPEFMVPVSQQ